MSFIGTAILGSAAIGAGASIWGSSQQVASQQAAQQQLAQQEGMTLSTIKNYLQPYNQFGQSFMPTLQSLLTPGPNQNATLSQLPGFQFANEWGQKGVTAQATTRGLGGNALTAGAEFGTGLAQQYFGQYIQNLLGATGIGANAAGTAAGAAAGTAGTFGPAIAQTTVGQGNALAGGAMGAAGATSGALNNLILAKALGLTGGMFGGQTAPTG